MSFHQCYCSELLNHFNTIIYFMVFLFYFQLYLARSSSDKKNEGFKIISTSPSNLFFDSKISMTHPV